MVGSRNLITTIGYFDKKIGLLRQRTNVDFKSITWVEIAYQGMCLGLSAFVSLLPTTDNYEKDRPI